MNGRWARDTDGEDRQRRWVWESVEEGYRDRDRVGWTASGGLGPKLVGLASDRKGSVGLVGG